MGSVTLSHALPGSRAPRPEILHAHLSTVLLGFSHVSCSSQRQITKKSRDLEDLVYSLKLVFVSALGILRPFRKPPRTHRVKQDPHSVPTVGSATARVRQDLGRIIPLRAAPASP